MEKNIFYEQLIKSEPLGFIDPFADLGEFDRFQLKFKMSNLDTLNDFLVLYIILFSGES